MQMEAAKSENEGRTTRGGNNKAETTKNQQITRQMAFSYFGKFLDNSRTNSYFFKVESILILLPSLDKLHEMKEKIIKMPFLCTHLYLDNFSTSIFIFIVDENKINLMLYWLSFE